MSEHIELYHGLASTCSKKVRLCLHEKRLKFVSHLLDLQKFEQHQPEYLALNPNGVVPTLVHRGRPITESSVIIEYLDDCFPEPPLEPEDPYDRAQMRLWIKFSDEVAYNAVFAPTWQRFAARAKEGLTEEKLAQTLSRIPTVERRLRWEKVASGGFSAEELEAAFQKMLTCLSRSNTQLNSTPWLAGERFSLADIAIIPFVERIANLRPELLSGGVYRALEDWLRRCRRRDSFEPAFLCKDDPRAAELPNF